MKLAPEEETWTDKAVEQVRRQRFQLPSLWQALLTVGFVFLAGDHYNWWEIEDGMTVAETIQMITVAGPILTMFLTGRRQR